MKRRYRRRRFRVEGSAFGGLYLLDLTTGATILVATPEVEQFKVGDVVRLDWRPTWYCNGVRR